jgi:hypothetical protein
MDPLPTIVLPMPLIAILGIWIANLPNILPFT